jgi:hypothetical protein
VKTLLRERAIDLPFFEADRPKIQAVSFLSQTATKGNHHGRVLDCYRRRRRRRRFSPPAGRVGVAQGQAECRQRGSRGADIEGANAKVTALEQGAVVQLKTGLAAMKSDIDTLKLKVSVATPSLSRRGHACRRIRAGCSGRAGQRMKLVAFTAPDGTGAEINPDQVADVVDAPPGEYDPRAKTLITLANGFRGVRESRAEVVRKLGVSP